MPNCNPGNKACGGRCIPQEQECDKALKRRGRNQALQAAGLAGAAAGAVVGGKILEGVGTAKATAHLVSHQSLGDKNLQRYEKVNARIQRRYGSTPKARQLSNAMFNRVGGIKGTKEIRAGVGLRRAAIPLGVLAGVKTIQSVRNYSAANKERKAQRGDSVWAYGFTHEPTESL